MKPRLYPENETNFESNGLGPLSDALACTVEENRNGAFELSMEYPVTGVLFDELKHGSIIFAQPNDSSEPQPFRVYGKSTPLSGVVTVRAKHISYRLSHIPVSPFTAGSCAAALQGLKTNAVEPCPFDFWTDKETVATFTVTEPASARSLLGGVAGSVLDVYGGEYEFDRYTVKLHKARGHDSGVVIAYGKNLVDIDQEESIENTITGVYPYYKDTDGNVLELPEKVVSSASAHNFPYPRTVPLDCSQEWQETPSVEQLRAYASAYVEKEGIGVPSVSLKVSFVPLWQTEEYKAIAPAERLNLCDIATVRFEKLGVNARAKVVQTVYDVLAGRYESITLGEASTNLADTIVAQDKAINAKADTSDLEAAAANASAWITGNKGGYVVLRRNADGQPYELLIMDKPTIEEATKVWRFNKSGLGYSSTGYNGTYGLAMTQDGQIVADYITTGTLSANLLRAGVMQDKTGKIFRLDLDGGTLEANFNSLKVSGKTTEQIAAGKADGALSDAKNYTDGKLVKYSTTTQMNSAIDQKASEITQTVSKTYRTEAQVQSAIDGSLTDYSTTAEMNSAIEQRAGSLKLSVERSGYFSVFEGTSWSNYTAGTFGNKITVNGVSGTAARLSTTDPDTLTYARGNTLHGSLSYRILTAIKGTSSSASFRFFLGVKYTDDTYTIHDIIYGQGNKTIAKAGNKTTVSLDVSVSDKEISLIYLEVSASSCSGVIEVGEVWANVAELNGKASTLTLTADGTKISSANIVMRGAVSFEDLSGTGRTDINGSNIATGCLANHDRSALFDLDGKRFRMGSSSGERVFIDKSGIQWYGGTGTTGATAQGVIKNGLTTTSSGDTTVYGADTRYQKYGWYHGGNFQGITVEQVDNEVSVSGKLSVNQEVSCRTLKAWDAKERVVRTPLGNLQMNAMESPEPLFWDVGSGVCDSTGVCWIALRPEYAETISRRTALRWVVTPTGGAGNLWVEKLDSGALVHGGSGQRFDWACAGVQRGFEGCYAEGDPGRYPVPENPGDWLLTAAMDEAAVDLPLTI